MMTEEPQDARPESAASSVRPDSSKSNMSRKSSAKSQGSRAASAKSQASRSDSAKSRTSTRSGSAKSNKALSRQGSAKSALSVGWADDKDKQMLIDDESPKKRENCCTKIISGMWASREMLKDNKDQQLFVKVTLRELILYCIFMFVIVYQTFAQYSPMYYTYTDMMKGLFTKQMDVTNMQLFWQFVEGDLLDGIYWETWYNEGKRRPDIRCPDGTWATGPCVVPPADRNVMYENRVLGMPRIRQLKVHNSSCNIYDDFKKAIKVCYAPYGKNVEDSERVVPKYRNYSDESAWTYHTEAALEGTSTKGQIATYSGAGYVQNFHYLKDHTRNIMSELKQGLWLTEGTRFVTIDFTVYNVNVNLFCVVKLTFEFPATGGVIPDQQFTTVRLLKYTEKKDYFLLACEVMFAIFIVYYIIEESLEIKVHKLNYFFNIWNLLDLLVIGISATQIAFSAYNSYVIEGLLDENLAKPFNFADFAPLANRSRTLTVLSALNIFVAWIKFFKYLSFNKTMTQLSGTLGAAAKDLSGFSVMFFIIYFAFVQLGYLLFGSQVRDFRTFMDSVFTLFRMILGDFNFRDIERANNILGPAYFLSYIFFVFFVLLNMFLAIINDTYGDVKADLKTRKPDFQMSDFFKTGANNVKSWMGIHDRAVDVENAIKLAAADDGLVTYEELRENLRKARFSDTEIDLFFYHFQNDPIISQIILDEEEVKARQMAKEKRRMSTIFDEDEGSDIEEVAFGSDDEDVPRRPRSGKEARKARSARIRSAMSKDTDPVPDSDFYNLQRRVDRMESSIAPLASKIDIVLTKLGADKKFTKNDMEKMFDQIIKADDDDAAKCEQMEEFVKSWDQSRPATAKSHMSDSY